MRRSDVDQAVALLQEHKESLPFDHIDVDQSVVKVSIVGAGMVDNAGVAAKMFGALYDEMCIRDSLHRDGLLCCSVCIVPCQNEKSKTNETKSFGKVS